MHNKDDYSDQIKEDEMGGAFITHGREYKYMQSFCLEARGEQIT
jgi:hypothetical protein